MNHISEVAVRDDKRSPYRLIACEYHNNGTAGCSFYAITFDYYTRYTMRRMIATVYGDIDLWNGVAPCSGRITVLDAMMAAAGNLGPDNQWDGYEFEPQIRQWIAQKQIASAAANSR